MVLQLTPRFPIIVLERANVLLLLVRALLVLIAQLGSLFACDTTKSKFVPAKEAALPASSKPNYLTSNGPKEAALPSSSKSNDYNVPSEATLPSSSPESTEVLVSHTQHISSLVIYLSVLLF
jgi:hypothetical protein